jgi:hypothetical protein
MAAQRQKPIDFATEGFRLAFPAERNYGIRIQCPKANWQMLWLFKALKISPLAAI